MTREEAEIVARIIGHADNGCSSCVGTLVDLANERIAGWRFEMGEEVYSDPDLEFGEARPDGWPNQSYIAVRVVEDDGSISKGR